MLLAVTRCRLSRFFPETLLTLRLDIGSCMLKTIYVAHRYGVPLSFLTSVKATYTGVHGGIQQSQVPRYTPRLPYCRHRPWPLRLHLLPLLTTDSVGIRISNRSLMILTLPATLCTQTTSMTFERLSTSYRLYTNLGPATY